jgi:pSer/pThr/pTyr-binding forkhead associated (FHA) protein
MLNGKKIPSYLPEELIDGDIIKLGKLTVEINIVRS